MPFGTFDDKKEAELLLGRVGAALELIREHDSYRYRRVIKRLNRIMVHPSPNDGEYDHEIRRCVLGAPMVKQVAITRIALVIIHESTHAELWDRGVGLYADKRRVEDVCVRQEIAFGRRLPDDATVLEDTEFLMMLPGEVWSNEAAWQRELEWAEREAVMPNWLPRSVARRRARMFERTRRRQATALANQSGQPGQPSSSCPCRARRGACASEWLFARGGSSAHEHARWRRLANYLTESREDHPPRIRIIQIG